MKIKRKIFAIILTAVIAGFAMAGYEAVNLLFIQNNEIGINVTKVGGILSELISNKDKKEISESIDPVTGAPQVEVPAKIITIGENNVLNKQTSNNKFTTSFNYKTVTYDFTFDYAEENGKKYILPNPERGYRLVAIPNSDNYLVEEQNNIFIVDPYKETINIFVKDAVAGFSYEELLKKHSLDFRPNWASHPFINPEGTKMLFYTNRAGESIDCIWVKDILTGEETPIKGTSASFDVLDWRDNRYAYVSSFREILEIDMDECVMKEIYSEKSGLVAFKYPNVFKYNKGKPSEIINIVDNTVTNYDDTNYDALGNIFPSNLSKYIVLNYFSKKTNNPFYSQIVLLDLETLEERKISVPEQYIVDGVSFYDQDSLLIKASEIPFLCALHLQCTYFMLKCI